MSHGLVLTKIYQNELILVVEYQLMMVNQFITNSIFIDKIIISKNIQMNVFHIEKGSTFS